MKPIYLKTKQFGSEIRNWLVLIELMNAALQITGQKNARRYSCWGPASTRRPDTEPSFST